MCFKITRINRAMQISYGFMRLPRLCVRALYPHTSSSTAVMRPNTPTAIVISSWSKTPATIQPTAARRAMTKHTTDSILRMQGQWNLSGDLSREIMILSSLFTCCSLFGSCEQKTKGRLKLTRWLTSLYIHAIHSQRTHAHRLSNTWGNPLSVHGESCCLAVQGGRWT